MRSKNHNLTATESDTSRIEYLDVAKGLLIILMVTGHVFLSGPVRNFIYTFHMPGFLIISGILFAKTNQLQKPIGKFLLSRFRTLIIPFITFEIIGVFTDIICNGISLNIFGYISNTLNQDWNNGPDGFLLHLLGAELLFYFLNKIPNRYISIAIGSIIMLCSFLLPKEILGGKLGIFRLIGIYLGFMFLGFYLYSKEPLSSMIRRPYIYISVAIIISIGISTFGVYVENTFGNFLNSVIYFTGAVFGNIFILGISKMLTKAKILKYFGRNSLIVMGTHNLLLLPARHYIPHSFDVPVEIALLIGILLLEIPIIFVIDRYVPFIIGRKMKRQ